SNNLDRRGRRARADAGDRAAPRRERRGHRVGDGRRAAARGRVSPAARGSSSRMIRRIAALLGKELAELRGNPSVIIPAMITGAISIVIPFAIAVGVPYFSGERLSDSSDFRIALGMYRDLPSMRGLDPEAAIQAMIFQQFLVLLLLTPVTGAMSIAAYAVIGEKQARTLEPLLATPLTTFELLAAKV